MSRSTAGYRDRCRLGPRALEARLNARAQDVVGATGVRGARPEDSGASYLGACICLPSVGRGDPRPGCFGPVRDSQRVNRENRATYGPQDQAGRGHQRLVEAANIVAGHGNTVG
jgi:hypothetical protein